jgi:hypothetical protein
VRPAALGLAALLGSAAPLAAAEGGPIRGGEHDGFTRVVLTIEPTTEWSLETSAERAVLRFPGRRLDFGTDGTFDRIPRSRVLAVTAAPDAAGTTVTVDLGCDCRVSASFVGARYLALDVADRDAVAPAATPPLVESDEDRARREAAIVSTAEQILLSQIERAADQGLVRLANKGAQAPAPAAPTTAPAGPPPDVDAGLAATLAALNDHEQVEATTVFDRDSRRALDPTVETPAACIPDERLDVGAWSNGLPFAAQLSPLRRRLVAEFDAADPEALRDLARLYLRVGLGAEAEGLTRSFPEAPLDDRALLVDLARTVEPGPALPEGPLAIPEPCRGRHGLWQALGGAAPAYRDAERFAAVQAQFAALPPDLRVMLAPRFVERLLDAGRAPEARLIYDTAVRPGDPSDPGLRLAAARLATAEGHPIEAARALAALIEASGHASVEALTELVRVALDAHLAIPDRIVVDLRAAVLQFRGSTREPELRALLAEALASRAELPEALRESRAATRDLPSEADRFAALAVRALAEADPAAVGPAAYAATALAAADFVAAAPADDPARDAIASRLLDLGLPEPALAMLPGAADPADARRLIAARARLRLGEPEAARAALVAMPEPEAAELRARAFALSGAWDRALATLDNRGLHAAAAPYAWPAGNWSRARAALAADPERLAMATYMLRRDGEAAPPPPSPDPSALAPAAAFAEPLPPLDRPSLDAARRLLAAGGPIGGFIEGVLEDD